MSINKYAIIKQEDRHADSGRHGWVQPGHRDDALEPYRELIHRDLVKWLVNSGSEDGIYRQDGPAEIKYLEARKSIHVVRTSGWGLRLRKTER